jgi:general secretion pathway protein D
MVTAPPTSPELCSNTPGATACHGSPKDLKAARKAFDRGLSLEKSKKLDEAYLEFQQAAKLVPQNVEYVTAREMTREHLAGIHLEHGNTELLGGRQIEALADFRAALELDPQNEFAQQRIRDALGPFSTQSIERPRLVESADSITAQPAEALHDFHFRGDSRALLTSIASSYGLSITFDESVPTKHVVFDVDNADFESAMRAASLATNSFTVAVEPTVLFAALDNPQNHRLYDRMGMRSYYIPGLESGKGASDLPNTLKTLFDYKFIALNAASGTLTVRAPLSTLNQATELIDQLNTPRPEVLFDVQAFEVSHSYMRQIGLHVPDNFNLFNIPESALLALAQGLGGTNIQQLINQLIASGGINQAGNSTLSALLSQLEGQNGLFSTPVATFGGGLTLMALTFDQLSAALSMNESSVRQLDHVQLRAEHDHEATFHLGERYPIMNASFAPVYNSSAIASVIGNQSYTAPFPSVSYEDIGFVLKVKPEINGDNDVALHLSLQMRSLGTSVTNGIPDILNREYEGGIMVKAGEPAVIAGMMTQQDQNSIAGLPFFSHVAGLTYLTSQHTKQESDDELLILLTPYIVRESDRVDPQAIWLPKLPQP